MNKCLLNLSPNPITRELKFESTTDLTIHVVVPQHFSRFFEGISRENEGIESIELN